MITPHDGVFLVRKTHVRQYVETFQPQCLRNSISSGKEFDLDYMNFGVSKGQTFNRVLIYPTEPIGKFISKGSISCPFPQPISMWRSHGPSKV